MAKHFPTEKTRTEVSTLAAVGTSRADIAAYIGIKLSDLDKHYKDELNKALVKANAAVGKALYDSATKGASVSAQIAWLNLQGGASQADMFGFDERKKVASVEPATKEELLSYWTSRLYNPRITPKDQLRASENLARAMGMFTEKSEITGKDGSPLVPPSLNIGFVNAHDRS